MPPPIGPPIPVDPPIVTPIDPPTPIPIDPPRPPPVVQEINASKVIIEDDIM